MRSLIAIAALVASVSASAGELDGKALTCKSENPFIKPEWIVFDEGEVFVWVIRRRGTTAEAEIWDRHEYTASIREITWGRYSQSRRLDRATLKLVQMNDDYEVTRTFQCEIPESIEAWQESLTAAEQRAQDDIDERMKDNKI